MEDKVLIKLDREGNITVKLHGASAVDIVAMLLSIARDNSLFALAIELTAITLKRIKQDKNKSIEE